MNDEEELLLLVPLASSRRLGENVVYALLVVDAVLAEIASPPLG